MQSLRARHVTSAIRLVHNSTSKPPTCRLCSSVFTASTPWTSRSHVRTYAIELNKLDKKWRQAWATEPVVKRGDAAEGAKMVVPMFPYPSGTLHLGHLRVYTVADVLARYKTLLGQHVLLPMGWDAFGLPAENAALERGVAPGEWTRTNIQKMREQLDFMNARWSWEREVTTCAPDFYKHTQKLFLMLYGKGLAYQAEAEVNYDPVDKTVLANEQVDANGHSWRSGAKVEKRQLKQWFFKISQFRDALLEDIDTLAKNGAWPERVIAQQKNWIGKSTGALIKFPVMAAGSEVGRSLEVFTTRPDTLFGVQYLALASTHPIVVQLAQSSPELQAFLDTLPGLPPDSKVGFLVPELRAVNPLAYHDDTPEATKASLPVYVAPYVLGDYGEGAVMGVPGHDSRDNAFWKQHNKQPIRIVLAGAEDGATTAIFDESPFTDHGVMTEHSGPFRGKTSDEAGEMIVRMLQAAKLAERVEKWRLRDWLISRQRYWGAPIPIIHCDTCGTVPVPEESLPVALPNVDEHWASNKVGNALESSPDFVNTTCPKCHGAAKRDTDTMDTFVDSSWYFARYADPRNEDELFSKAAAKLLPVDTYIGGVEHAILHLLYARFIYKFLASEGMLGQHPGEEPLIAEPFQRLITQGMVHGKTYVDPDTGKFLKPDEVDLKDPSKPQVVSTGKTAEITFEKMSKSKHNGVDPTEFISQHGADATRAHMLFQAPVADVLNWDGTKVSGVTRWLNKLHDQIEMICAEHCQDSSVEKHLRGRLEVVNSMSEAESKIWDDESALWREVQMTIGSVQQSYNDIYSLNTVVSDLMSLTNKLISCREASILVRRRAAERLIIMMAPICPAFAEECWAMLKPGIASIFSTGEFPSQDGLEKLLIPRAQSCAVQVNGKVRGVVQIPTPPEGMTGDELKQWMIQEIMKTEEGTAKFSDGPFDLKKAKRAIAVRGGKVINFVM